MASKNKKISSIFRKNSLPDSHKKAITYIAFQYKLTPQQVSRYIEFFFGVGIIPNIKKRKAMKINKFGTIYFHKKTLEAYQNRRKK